MDTNDNIYILNYANQETKIIAQDQSSLVDENPTLPFHNFNPFLHSVLETHYNVFNVKNTCKT
jgi:hypothetical protein